MGRGRRAGVPVELAQLALLGARDLIAAGLGGLGPVDQALTRDLLARLDAAISPYFQ